MENNKTLFKETKTHLESIVQNAKDGDLHTHIEGVLCVFIYKKFAYKTSKN